MSRHFAGIDLTLLDVEMIQEQIHAITTGLEALSAHVQKANDHTAGQLLIPVTLATLRLNDIINEAATRDEP